MFIDKYLIPVMRWVFIFGVPAILFGLGVFFIIKIFFMPTFSSGRVRKKQTDVVIDQRCGAAGRIKPEIGQNSQDVR